jgi:hypothetical protein
MGKLAKCGNFSFEHLPPPPPAVSPSYVVSWGVQINLYLYIQSVKALISKTSKS